MPHVLQVEQVSAAFFLMTSLLLAYASFSEVTASKRIASGVAVLTVICAITLLMMAYAGEKELVFDRSGTSQAQARGERGHFEGARRDEDGGGSGRGGNQAGNGSEGRGEGAQAEATFSGQLAALLPGNQRRKAVAETLQDCPECPALVTVKPAYFRMGASPGDPDALPSEGPPRVVRIQQWFAIGRLEVTVGQYAAFVRATGHPAPACGMSIDIDDPRLPVSCVNRRDALAYLDWLRVKTGKAYRLPSEAEWEYAARGGIESRYASGQDIQPQHANIGRRGATTVPAGSFPGNGFGLKDVHGSVAELVADCWSETLRAVPGEASRWNQRGDCSRTVLRDAGATEQVVLSRLSARRPISVDEKRHTVGFRVMRELEKNER